MAAVMCGKALWSVVCGTNVLPSNDVVGEELEAAADHLRAGVHFYSPFSQADHDQWTAASKLKKNQKTFVLRLAKMLNLCSRQSWELFQVFLQEEYRGSSSELASVLSSYRSESRLLHQIYGFYLTDPMHLLSCRTLLLAAAGAKRDHPYQELFADFIKEVLDPKHDLGSSMAKELQSIHESVIKYRDRQEEAFGAGVVSSEDSTAKPPEPSALDFVAGNPDLPDDGEMQWLAARLALAKHLLASLLVYYAHPSRPRDPGTVLALVSLAQGEGVCGGVTAPGCSTTAQAAISSILKDIDALHSLLLTLLVDADVDLRTQRMTEPEIRDKLDAIFMELGSRPGHLPPLLAWCVLQGRLAASDSSGSSVASSGGGVPARGVQRYSRMAVRAMDGGVMACLQNFLNNQAIVSDKLLREVCGSIVYSLVCVVATQLSLDQHSACSVQLSALAVSCLSGPLPAHLFWAEEEGAAALLLPDALAVFPDEPRPLLSLCSALAAASAHSCSKVVELLAELPSLTWRMSSVALAGSCREVGGAQLVTHSELQLLPGLCLPPHTSGTLVLPPPSAPLHHRQHHAEHSETFLVQWHAPSNVWQLILAAVHALDSQIRSGTTVWEWLVQFVEESLQLVCNMLKSDGSLISSLEHIIEQVFAVIKSVSSVAEPREKLVRWLLATAAAVSEHRPELVWRSVDRCGLLPCLPLATASRDRKLVAAESGVEYYRCGALRKIVCGHEAAAGDYPTLRSFCSMLSSALKARLPTRGSIRGGVVFVVREVVPYLVLQWGYRTATEKVQVLEAVMQVLHHALEYSNEDQQIATEVCSELSNQSGGATLRAVLEAGACLEASLDAPPAQWPHACHAASLARTAHLALSILHRLVFMHCDDSQVSAAQHKHRLKNLLAGHQRRPLSQGSLLPSQGPSHLTLTVAQFVHHRLNSSLPYLALRILTKLALELEVPLVACLGSQAEVIKELLLYRLRAAAEDTRVKVSITRLLTAAVASQPGLLRAFLSPPEALMEVLTDLLTAHYSYAANSSAGGGGRETTSDQLLSSIVELVAALWAANHAAAITALRDCSSFWTVLVTPLASSRLDEEDESVVEQTVRLIALEHFLAARDNKKQLAVGLSDALTEVYVNNWTRLNKHMIGWVSSGGDNSQGVRRLRCWRDLLWVLLASYPTSVNDQGARSLCETAMQSLTGCLGSPEDPVLRGAAHLTADILLMLATHRASLCSGQWYWGEFGRVLEALRASLLQTPAPTQVRLLSALLLALRHLQTRSSPMQNGRESHVAAHDLSSGVLDALRAVVEQHCSLSSGEQTEHFCSNAAVLQVACSALHLCLVLQPHTTLDRLLSSSHLVSALLHAAAVHMRSGAGSVSALSVAQHASSTAVSGGETDASSSGDGGADDCSALVSIIGRLLTMLAAREASAPLLNTEQLSTSVALAATALHSDEGSSGEHRALSEVLMCAVQSVRREGVPGVEGCIAITATHLGALVQALAMPQLRPELAATSASLTAALAPHRRLWIAFHPHSYWTMVEATAASLHLSTHLVRLKALLGQEGKTVTAAAGASSSETKPSEGLTARQTRLLNKLLRVVLWCVRAVRLLGPTLDDLLCSPDPDVGQWLPSLLQPSFRRATAPDLTQPNLATLTTLLDICTAHLKEQSSKKEEKSNADTDTVARERLSTEVLSACAEEALLLLLTQSALALLSPETSNREARDIRTWLQDDTNSFFSHWLGKRSNTTSPALSHTSDQRSGGLDRRFLRVAQHLVNTLCSSSSSS